MQQKINIQDDSVSPQETLPVTITETETLTADKQIGDTIVPSGTTITTVLATMTIKDINQKISDLTAEISPLQNELNKWQGYLDSVNVQMANTMSSRAQQAIP